MSDLQCAARFLLLPPFAAEDADRLADMLRLDRVASVYAAPHDLVPAERLAARLGVPARSVAVDVADLAPGSGVLSDLADRHRGETLVAVTAGVAGPQVMLVDGDGWSVLPWGQNSRASGSSTPRSAS